MQCFEISVISGDNQVRAIIAESIGDLWRMDWCDTWPSDPGDWGMWVGGLLAILTRPGLEQVYTGPRLAASPGYATSHAQARAQDIPSRGSIIITDLGFRHLVRHQHQKWTNTAQCEQNVFIWKNSFAYLVSNEKHGRWLSDRLACPTFLQVMFTF